MGSKFLSMKDLADKVEKERPDILDSMEDSELEFQVARQLREFRKAAKVSQSELTKTAKLTQAQISRIERGSIKTFGNLKKVLDALDLEIKVVPKKKKSRVHIAAYRAKVTTKKHGYSIISVKSE